MNLAEMTAQFIAGTYLANEHVRYRRAQQVTVTATPGMWFNLDGELLTNEPVKLAIRPRTLRIVVGRDYAPDGITLDKLDYIPQEEQVRPPPGRA
jgi:diacylglycerol kinase (ATP)